METSVSRLAGLAAALLFSLFLLPSASFAASTDLWISDSSGRLARVGISTGAVTEIGNMGRTMTDIAFDSSGNLYGITFTDLYSINSTTGASTLIGNLGVNDANSLTFGADGTLYMARDEVNTNLYTVDTSTAIISAIGATGFKAEGDLAFNGGDMYMSTSLNSLAEVDILTGAGIEIGSFGVGDVFGLATAGDGLLYGAAGTNIYLINTGTGAASMVSSYGGQGVGSAFGATYYVNAIPIPGAVWLFGSALAGLGWLRRRTN